ncbi:hypothetical protein N7495_000317 [Penicillium taxi]|uniref:uncharacterized protein n=1 Tax=Penicillium taxi TaxID=168475 RepID=UPI0025452D7B|nr:uncharacterized protein N7495_000317 [Penicillium taxi]KAJ5907635.1 hypothetical protein N7495_000317 [Penicillium taxi]
MSLSPRRMINSTPEGSTSTKCVSSPADSSDWKPLVLVVSEEGPGRDSITSAVAGNKHANVLFDIASQSTILELKLSECVHHLHEYTHAIIVIDEWIRRSCNIPIWEKLIEYMQDGGTVIFLGDFALFLDQDYYEFLPAIDFFEKSGNSWERGECMRTTVFVNNEDEIIPKNYQQLIPPTLDVHGRFLTGVTPKQVWYQPNSVSVTEPQSVLGYYSRPVDPKQIPVALASVGKGKMGYIGAFHDNPQLSPVLAVMCDLSNVYEVQEDEEIF